MKGEENPKQQHTADNIPDVIKENMKLQKVKAANSWRTIGCNGILDLNPHFPKIDGQYIIVHQLD